MNDANSEVLHLTYFLMRSWDNYVLSRPEIREDKTLLKITEDAADALYDAYAVMGNKWMEDEK